MATTRISSASRWPAFLQQVLRQQQINTRNYSFLSANATKILNNVVEKEYNAKFLNCSNVFETMQKKPQRTNVATSNSTRNYSVPAKSVLKAGNSEKSKPIPTEAFYEIELTVKAYEERYVDMAVNTLRDLLMISFTPKKFTPMEGSKFGDEIRPSSPVDLYVPQSMERVKVNWKDTRFTLIRGVFADKRGMEQFERREYHSKIKAVTTSVTELQWLLDSLRLYEFTGVQIEAEVRTPGFVAPHEHQAVLKTAPAATAAPAVADFVESMFLGDRASVLGAGHLRHIKDYVPSTSAAAAASSSSSASAGGGFGAELQSSLSALRRVMHQGLEERRRALGMSSEYDAWLRQQQLLGNAAATKRFPVDGLSPEASDPTAVAASPSDIAAALLKTQVDKLASTLQNGPGSVLGAAGSSSSSSSSEEEQEEEEEEGGAAERSRSPAEVRDRKVAAFLAAVDAVFLNLRFDALDNHTRFPLHFATAVPGELKVPVTMWMQAVAKMGEYQRAVGEAGREAELLRSYAAYSSFSQALLYKMLQVWFETTSADAKDFLALPSWEEYEAMIRTKRQ